MDIVDCFCGVGPWATKDRILPSEPEELLAIMDHMGVSRALAYHNVCKFGGWTRDANRRIAAIAAAHPRFIPAFEIGLHPYEDGPTMNDYLDEMRTCGGKALWLKLPFTPYRLVQSYQRWLIGDWMQMCEARRIPVFFHTQGDSIDIVQSLCAEYPALRLVITGVMYGQDAILYPLLRQHRNLRVCTGHAYIPSGNPAHFLRHFSSDRLLFGSGLPEYSPGGMIAHVRYADIAEEDKARILGGTISELMAEVRL